MLVLAAALVFGAFAITFRKPSLQPGKTAIALESLVVFVRDDIVYPIMGEERGKKWVPFFSTLFLFILMVNFLGLIPSFKAATGNISVTTALALPIFILIFAVGFLRLGFVTFFKNFYPEGTFLPLGLFIALVEFIGVFIKSSVLSIRIFANMLGGHMSILTFIMLIFIISPFCTFFSVPIALFTYIIEVLVALIQAIVFVLLGCVYIAQASSVHGET